MFRGQNKGQEGRLGASVGSVNVAPKYPQTNMRARFFYSLSLGPRQRPRPGLDLKMGLVILFWVTFWMAVLARRLFSDAPFPFCIQKKLPSEGKKGTILPPASRRKEKNIQKDLRVALQQAIGGEAVGADMVGGRV